jgi:hypothetical protein
MKKDQTQHIIMIEYDFRKFHEKESSDLELVWWRKTSYKL